MRTASVQMLVFLVVSAILASAAFATLSSAMHKIDDFANQSQVELQQAIELAQEGSN